MMKAIIDFIQFQEVFDTIESVFNRLTSMNDGFISDEGVQILSNSEDLKAYENAVEKLEKGIEKETELELSNGEKITLIG